MDNNGDIEMWNLEWIRRATRWTRRIVGVAVMTVTLVGAAGGVSAQEIHGFVEGLVGSRTASGSGFEDGDYTAQESRLQLRLNDYMDNAEYLVRLDAFLDQVTAEESEVELREAFFTYTGWSWADARVGRQILTWGTGDLLFINDVFPKDWESFFIGREDQYLKAPLDALRVGVYSGTVNLNVALVPRFEPDRLPTPGRLAFYDPIGATAPPIEPSGDIGEGEIAGRAYRTFGTTELALYAYYGHNRQPLAFSPASMRAYYPGLSVYGASARRGLFGGVANLEAGYHDSREDRDGDDPTVENSSLRWMAGFDRQLWTDFQLGVQGYYEWMQDHDDYVAGLAPGSPERDELRQLYTIRVTQWLKYQTVRLSGFTFFSPTDEDYYVRASASYKIADPVEFVIGANVFGGSETETLFGQLEHNDNVYFRARYSF